MELLRCFMGRSHRRNFPSRHSPQTIRTTDGEGRGDAYLIAGSYLPLLPDHFDEDTHTIDNLLEKVSTLHSWTSYRELGLSPPAEPEKLWERLAANSHMSE